MNQEIFQLAYDWSEAKRNLDYFKELEMRLRKVLIAQAFEPAADEKGARRFDLLQGWKLKADFKLTYKLENTNSETAKLIQALSDSGHEDVAETAIRWKPDLVMSVFNKLPPDIQRLFTESGALTVSPATPALTLEPPKG